MENIESKSKLRLIECCWKDLTLKQKVDTVMFHRQTSTKCHLGFMNSRNVDDDEHNGVCSRTAVTIRSMFKWKNEPQL